MDKNKQEAIAFDIESSGAADKEMEVPRFTEEIGELHSQRRAHKGNAADEAVCAGMCR